MLEFVIWGPDYMPYILKGLQVCFFFKVQTILRSAVFFAGEEEFPGHCNEVFGKT